MRAGENITYPAPGHMEVTLPFYLVKDGESRVIGHITITERADLHLMDPDAAFVKDDTGIHYCGFRKVTRVEIEEEPSTTPYIYKNKDNKACHCDIQRVGLGEGLINNRTCPQCGKDPLHTMHCQMFGGAAACEEHCSICEHHTDYGCRYVKKPVDKPP